MAAPFHPIRQLLAGSYDLPEAEWADFLGRWHRRVVPRHTRLLAAGQVESALSWLEEGLVCFAVPQEAREVTFAFVFAGEFFSAYDSLVQQLPATYQVQALTAATVWSISRADLQRAYATSLGANYLGRLAAEQLYVKKLHRELALLTQTAEQRYRALLAREPRLLQHVPLRYLASYLGITPQALSRIRRRIS